MQPDIEYQVETLTAKTKHYLMTVLARIPEEANDEEIYRALCYALREEIMINWLACARTFHKNDVRMLYYLSMEYLPGRILSNNITNIAASPIVMGTLQKLNRSVHDVIRREPDPGLGNGGLGRLASCFLDSLATQHYPARAYGLRYQYGIFEQQLWDGMQVEAPDLWLFSENPWLLRHDLRRVVVQYSGQPVYDTNIHGDEIITLKNSEEVSALPFDIPIVGYNPASRFSVVTLRLWSTRESPRNFQLQSYNAGRLDQAAENTLLTDVLYPNDLNEVGKRIRLKQEFLLVSASLQDIIRHYQLNHDNFRAFSDKVRIQINDTHPALVVPELVRLLTRDHEIPWRTAVEMTQAVTGYTNHTVLAEALEEWEQPLMFRLLAPQYKIIERLNHDFCNATRMRFPNNEEMVQRTSILENGRVRMANLAIIGSHMVNGVAQLHSEILKNRVFHDFYTLYPDRFTNVTNGVTQRRWLLHCNPDLAKFVTRHIGDGWITDFSKIGELHKLASDHHCQEEFLAIKKKNKQHLIDYINEENQLRNAQGEITAPAPLIDVNSIFDVQIKRIHEYKRQLMNILHVIALYLEIVENPDNERLPRTVIFGGKAASGYETAKDIIRLIFCVARKVNRDPQNHKLRVVYIENYNVSRAEMIIPAADLSEQISQAGMEGSGTSNMKLAINGALTIGTDDGANIEMRKAVGDQWWPFNFGGSAEEIQKLKESNGYHSAEYYHGSPKIKRIVDTLRDRTFATNDNEHQVLSDLFHKLVEGHYGGAPDRFFTLYDLLGFCEAQKKVEALYSQPHLWAQHAIENMAAMGTFSSDVSIKRYADEIWNLKPMPIDEDVLERVRHEYSVLDVCRVYK